MPAATHLLPQEVHPDHFWGNVTDPNSQVILCFDLQTPVTKVKETMYGLEQALTKLGATVVSIDFGKDLLYRGCWIRNDLRNKMVLSLRARYAWEEAMSREILERFVVFFKGKIVRDPEEPES